MDLATFWYNSANARDEYVYTPITDEMIESVIMLSYDAFDAAATMLADIHQFTDGSDDGFLYCRGFIVALGRDFYGAVNANPANALVDFECYAITYLSQELFQEKFGKMPASGISRESFSNAAGWAR